MNLLLWLLLALSFGVAFAIGFFTKKFRFLFLSVLCGAVIAAVSLWLYFTFTPPDVGLGIIAILPAVAIIVGVLHLVAVLLGGVLGTGLGRRNKESSSRS
jgi:hypothetical protein